MVQHQHQLADQLGFRPVQLPRPLQCWDKGTVCANTMLPWQLRCHPPPDASLCPWAMLALRSPHARQHSKT